MNYEWTAPVWREIIVAYGGEWNGCSYVGGGEDLVHIPEESICLYSLIYDINNLMQSRGLSTDYQIHYLSISRFGRSTKSVLSTDESLANIFRTETNPKVYVSHNDPVRGFDYAHQEGYIHSFDLNDAVEVPFDDETVRFQRMNTSCSWFDKPYTGGSDNYASGSTHRATEDQHEHSHRWRESVDVGPMIPNISDDDYDEASDASTDVDYDANSNASSEIRNESIIKFTFADFQSWVNTEGGLTKLMSMLNPANDGGLNPEIAIEERNNWLLPIIPLDTSESLVRREFDPSTEDGEIGVGSYYSTKDDLEVAVGLWHMVRGVDFIVPKSNHERVVYKCKHSKNCEFELRGIRRGNVWAVHRFKADHTCLLELGELENVKVKADVVAAFAARKMRSHSRILKPREIQDELRDMYGITISYDVALRGRNNGVELIYGGHASSFQMLPGYLHKLVEENPGTLTDLEVGEDGKFQHLFIALGHARIVYNYCLRPVIVVDGAHLKGRNKGILFVAVTIDANEQVFPLAYGVGPLENDVSWTWFLERLHVAYGSTQNTVIISDAHKSIANAVRQVYPNAHHALCFFHILNKLKSYGKPVTDVYTRAAYAYTTAEYEKHMITLHSMSIGAYEYLVGLGPEKWARARCPFRRYSCMTSNHAEVWNKRLVWARRLPICALIEAIRHVIEAWIIERRELAQGNNDVFAEKVITKLLPGRNKSRSYKVQRLTGVNFRVRDQHKPYTVDLHVRSCECRQFDLDGMPCSHAIAAIRNKRADIKDYVEHFFLNSTLVKTYSIDVNPVPHKDEWHLPTNVANMIVLPPINRPQAGRPSNSSRRRGATERRSCRRNTNQAESSRQRAPKKCSRCSGEGHNRNNCPTDWNN